MLTRVGSRVTTISLAAVILFVLSGLAAVEWSLTREDAAHARSDARRSAGLVESFLDVHAASLGAFRGLFVADAAHALDRERFLGIVSGLGGHANGFRRVWIADASGVVVQEQLFGGTGGPLASGFDLDTAPRLGALMAAARATGRTQLSAPGPLFSGERGVVIIEPVRRGELVVGFAGGSIPATALGQAAAGGDEWAPRTRITLRSGQQVVAQVGDSATAGPVRTMAAVRVPGGTWELLMEHGVGSRRAERALLWGVGVSVLIVLTLALMHERRQSQRIADRSSELERLSGELLAANRAKSEFLANISHELRTPLNAIVGFADLLRDGVYGELSPRQAPPVQRIEASATHLRMLVDQILDLAKMAAGRLEVHVETIDLRPFVLEVASEVESLINEKGLSLSIAVGATLPRARTDPTHLRQILVNLLGNAVKYTEKGGIAIRARLVRPGDTLPLRNGGATPPPATTPPRPEGTWVALQVIDTGVGVAADDRERIFEEFEQVNAGARGDTARRGTGLGLPISRRLARLLGGEVTLDSEMGRGSTFTLWLPVE